MQFEIKLITNSYELYELKKKKKNATGEIFSFVIFVMLLQADQDSS